MAKSNNGNKYNSAYELFRKQLNTKHEETSYDKNANAAAFSFSSFAMDYASKGLAELTVEAVNEQAYKIMSKEAVDFFWQHEAHTAPEGNAKYFYFHDITKGIIPYCYAASTGRIMAEGLRYVDDYPSSKPQRFDSFVAQVIDLVLEMSQEHAGAIAIPDLFVNSAEFFKSAEEVYANKYDIANIFQSMIFTFHRKVRPSGQSPFVNVTIADTPTLKTVFQQNDEQIAITKALQLVFLEEFDKGCDGKPFRFPVVTVNIALDSGKNITDMPWLESIAKYLKSGRQNIYISADPRKFASCCRMSNDLDLLMQMTGTDSFGNGGVSIGSHRVITLNLPKIIQDNKYVTTYTATVIQMLKAHRELLRELITHPSKKFLKFFQHKWQNLDSQFFSTVGIIGIWEAAVISLKKAGNTEPALGEIIAEIKLTMEKIKKVVNHMSKELKMPINIEQIPGESSAADLGSEIGVPILSNQYIPLWEDVDLIDRIRYAGELDELFTGGAITHLNIEKQLCENAILTLIKLAGKAGMTHFAANHVYSQCENGHNSIGRHSKCPVCEAAIKDYITRIIGYFVPISSWNKHRKQEFNTRKFKSICDEEKI